MLNKKGNALFLILIAVALFAALSYALTQSSKGEGASRNKEAAVLGAGRILTFASQVDSALQRLMLSTKSDVQNVYYNNTITRDGWGIYSNGSLGSPADPTLYLFHPAGGGAVQQSFLDLTTPCATCDQSALLPGRFALRWGNVNGVGTSTADLLLIVVYLSDAVCTAINSQFGITGIPVVGLSGGYPSYGVLPGPPAYPAGAGAAAISGKLDACVRNTASIQNTGNTYYHVLVVQ